MLYMRPLASASSTGRIACFRLCRSSARFLPIRLSSTSSDSSIPAVIGTAPQMQRHLLVHTPQSADSWPSHLDSASSLYRQLGNLWSTNPDLQHIGFNFTDAGAGKAQPWDKNRTKFEKPDEAGEPEVYSATLYPDFLPIEALSTSSLPSLQKTLASLPPVSAPPSPSSSSNPPRTHIFICTHTSRDCRCGDLGEPLYQALVKEAERRKVGGELNGKLSEGGVRIARVAHVGGHKWAGNALVYKDGGAGDWYGLLRASDAPQLLDYALSASPSPWYARWRGRLGMSSEAVQAEYLAQSGSAEAKGRKEERRNELGEVVELRFVTYEGEERVVKGYEGETLMETGLRHDLPSILAICGGHCECATCHVHLPPLRPSPPSSSIAPSSSRQPTPVPQDAPIPEMTDEEDEQLEFAIGADDASRLACQIPVTRELGEWCAKGGRIKLPRY
ncbi:hypothetical protein JCM11641_004340 [Rhodosporidiobolus odoratus]